MKASDEGFAPSETFRNVAGAAVPVGEPDHLRWSSQNEAPLVKVVVLGNDYESLLLRDFPNLRVRRSIQSEVFDVRRAWKPLPDDLDPLMRQVLIQQQLHLGRLISLRSLSAAKARHARMSSGVNSGKSCTISASDIPDAKYSR